MRQLANLRKAGPGETLTRWVKTPGRHQSGRPTAPAPANAERTRFLSRVIAPADMRRVLVSGHSNVKLGRDVRVGKLTGYWIYTLSLEERATCPSSCQHWRTCYGNAMPFAKRVRHGPELLAALEREIAHLLSVRGRRGILIRLHALGDFYSPDYVLFWRRMLATHSRLAVFGYTAHSPKSETGRLIAETNALYADQCWLRFSNGGLTRDCAVSIDTEAECPPSAFVCPEQTGKRDHCATCGACWGTRTNVAFLAH